MKRILLGIMSVFFILSVMAEKDGHFFMDVKDQSIRTENAESYFDKWFNLDAESKFVKVSEDTDMIGMKHTVYRQYFNNIEVENCMILVHSANGYVMSVNGHIMEKDMNDGMPESNSLRSSDTKKICFVSVNKNGETRFRPAYKSFSDNGAMTYYVDVENGDTVKRISNVYEATNYESVKCKGVTRYSGVQEMDCAKDGSSYYYLIDRERKLLMADASVSDQVQSIYDLPLYKYGTSILGGFISEVKIESSSKDWIGWESEPDIYFVIKDNKGKVTYRSKVIEVKNYPIKFDIEDDCVLFTEGYSILFYDDDSPLDDDYAGYWTNDYIVPESYSFSTTNGNVKGTIKTTPNPALDAYWGIQKAYDYFSETFDKKGFNDNPIMLFYPGPEDRNAGAVYDEEKDIYYMVFGKGDKGVVNPFVTLDCAAHEYTHNVTKSNGKGGLVYEGESGALNESFSDIFGCAVEFYVRGEDGNWDLLEGVGEGINYYVRRSMKNPKKYFQPDTYKGDNWAFTEKSTDPNENNDHGGVHCNSGVQNKWFYLLCEGGKGTNDNGNEYNVEGIGIDDAQVIAYLVLNNMLTPEATFKDAAEGSVEVAKHLDEQKSTGNKYHKSVYDAWYAVGLFDVPFEESYNSVDPVCVGRDFDAFVSNGTLYVRMEEGKKFYVYDALGVLICEKTQSDEYTTVDVAGKSFVLVESEGVVRKCIVK